MVTKGTGWGWEWGSIPEAKVHRACPRLRLKQESRNPPTPVPSHTLSNRGRWSTARVGGRPGERPLLYRAVTQGQLKLKPEKTLWLLGPLSELRHNGVLLPEALEASGPLTVMTVTTKPRPCSATLDLLSPPHQVLTADTCPSLRISSVYLGLCYSSACNVLYSIKNYKTYVRARK